MQRSADRDKFGAQLRTDPIHSGDDRKCDARCEQAVFNGCRASFVVKEPTDASVELEHYGTLAQSAQTRLVCCPVNHPGSLHQETADTLKAKVREFLTR